MSFDFLGGRITRNTIMKHYKEIAIEGLQPHQSDLFVALLAQAGYTGFEESADGRSLKAYIGGDDFQGPVLEDILQRPVHADHQEYPAQQDQTVAPLHYVVKDIEEENWNALWESNFDPVVLDDFVVVRADFHKMAFQTTHEIIITPKMSFGTGHHSTTYMMMDQMRQLDLKGRRVFDFGTGTGILAILAVKLGAKSVLAIDNDDWSIENAAENIRRNHSSGIQLKKGHTAAVEGSFGVLLANINKNVIIANADFLTGALQPGGYLLLSGLLNEDEPDILGLFEQLGLRHIRTVQRLQWICMLWQAKL